MKKVLITGATGFVGGHLTDHLALKKEFEIFGTSLTDSQNNDKIQIEKIDLTDFDQVLALIQKIKPDQIYHLAALTSPGDSFTNATPIVLSNIGIEMNLLNAMKEVGLGSTRFLVVSSAEVYGMVTSNDLPIDEETPLRPTNPYAVSKITQDYLGLQYILSYKFDVLMVRPFNHTGPGQSPAFAIPAFAKQIAMIEKGKQESVLKVGNLSAKRDFSDVRDIVKGYADLMEKGVTGEIYNIGSGKSRSTKELLDSLLSLTDKKIIVEEDPSKIRPIEVPDSYCNFSKINSLTGWSPEIPIEKTLQDTLDYWRNIV